MRALVETKLTGKIDATANKATTSSDNIIKAKQYLVSIQPQTISFLALCSLCLCGEYFLSFAGRDDIEQRPVFGV